MCFGETVGTVFAAQIASRDLGHAAADGPGLYGPGGLALVCGDHLDEPTANGLCSSSPSTTWARSSSRSSATAGRSIITSSSCSSGCFPGRSSWGRRSSTPIGRFAPAARTCRRYVFLVCWIGVFFGFWSTCSTKLPHYVLPAYPALAILTGCFLQAWIERAEAAARHVMPIATSIFLGVGVAMLAVLPLGDRAVCSRRTDRGASRAGAGRGRRLELVLPGPRPAAIVPGRVRRGLGALHHDALRLGGSPHRPASALPAADGGSPSRQSWPSRRSPATSIATPAPSIMLAARWRNATMRPSFASSSIGRRILTWSLPATS